MNYTRKLIGYILMASLTVSSIGYSDVLSVDKLDLEYKKLDPYNRDPFLPQYTGRWRDSAALFMDISVFNYGYWNNHVHQETVSPGSVRSVGWEWEAGFRATGYLDIFTHHHSRHVLEEEPDERFRNTSGQFPLENSYGIRIHLIRTK